RSRGQRLCADLLTGGCPAEPATLASVLLHCGILRSSTAEPRRAMGEHETEQGASREELTQAERLGMYRPAGEHDACGVGFVAHIAGSKSHSIVEQGLKVLENLT